jgi:LPS export ABC transporter protein LptC
MLKWQKTLRLVIALVAVAVAVVVAATMRKRSTPVVQMPVARTDPKAVLESAGGQGFRFDRNREDVRVAYDKMLTYPDGSNKMIGVKVTTERDGRTFEITGAEGRIGEKDSTVEVIGNVNVTASDGLTVRTEHVTYTEADGISRAPGNVEFSRGRMSGTGVGFVYDKNLNILTILDQAVVSIVR